MNRNNTTLVNRLKIAVSRHTPVMGYLLIATLVITTGLTAKEFEDLKSIGNQGAKHSGDVNNESEKAMKQLSDSQSQEDCAIVLKALVAGAVGVAAATALRQQTAREFKKNKPPR